MILFDINEHFVDISIYFILSCSASCSNLGIISNECSAFCVFINVCISCHFAAAQPRWRNRFKVRPALGISSEWVGEN